LDDASTDRSLDALRPFHASIRIECAAKNGGQNVSRNRLTAMSRGEWLVYLDADDELAADNVEQKMRYAAMADAIYGSTELATFHGAEKVGATKTVTVDYPAPWAAAFLWKFPNTSALFFRRSAVLDAGGWNESIQNCTDYDLYFRLLERDRRFKAAPEAWSLYRQWSLTQAVYENSLRRTNTRLELMWRSVLQLEQANQLTEGIRQAFSNAAFAVIRTLHQLEPARAFREHNRLKQWNSSLVPSVNHFSKGYCAGYRLLGFRGAEFLAKMTRFVRPNATNELFKRSGAGT